MALFSLHLPANAHEGDMEDSLERNEKKSTEVLEEAATGGIFSTSRSNKRPHRKDEEDEEEEEEEEEVEMKESSTAPPSSKVSTGLRPSIPRLPPGFIPKSGGISKGSSREFQERPRPEGEGAEGETRGFWEPATPNLGGGGDGAVGESSQGHQRKWEENPSKTSRSKSSIWSRNNCCWKLSASSSNSPEDRHSDEAEEVVVGPTFRKGPTRVQETWEPTIESDDDVVMGPTIRKGRTRVEETWEPKKENPRYMGTQETWEPSDDDGDDNDRVVAMEGAPNPLQKGIETVQSVGKF